MLLQDAVRVHVLCRLDFRAVGASSGRLVLSVFGIIMQSLVSVVSIG